MKYPPWFDTTCGLLILICMILGFGGLLSPTKSDAATKCVSASQPLEWYATCPSTAELPMICAEFAVMPQEARSADASYAVCFGHCIFSTSNTSNSNTTWMTDSDPTKLAGRDTKAAILRKYFATMPVRHDLAAYTSEGVSTGRFTGAASMYAEASPTYRLAPPEYVRTNRLFRLPAKATRASPRVIVDIT